MEKKDKRERQWVCSMDGKLIGIAFLEGWLRGQSVVSTQDQSQGVQQRNKPGFTNPFSSRASLCVACATMLVKRSTTDFSVITLSRLVMQ